jgi:hypothetical protein
LSSISKRNTADSPAKATHASRNDRGERGDRPAASSRTENSRLEDNHRVCPEGMPLCYVTKFSCTRE